jgi:hypothetical protein
MPYPASRIDVHPTRVAAELPQVAVIQEIVFFQLQGRDRMFGRQQVKSYRPIACML